MPRILPDERKESAVAFLQAALAYCASLGVSALRVIDNGSCYRSRAFAKTCRQLELKHLRTPPYTPRTNGKAERFIQSALKAWAYAQPYLNLGPPPCRAAGLAPPLPLASATQWDKIAHAHQPTRTRRG